MEKRNYLRVRGEYFDQLKEAVSGEELPPRARRILVSDAFSLSSVGTTSACAENTNRTRRHRHRTGNYLRVRGEYKTERQKGKIIMELPPRARRIRSTAP